MMSTTQTWKIGDCIELMRENEPDSVDLIVTYPPYFMELTCTNKECGWMWNYRGKKMYPAYVTCPNCMNKVKLHEETGNDV